MPAGPGRSGRLSAHRTSVRLHRAAGAAACAGVVAALLAVPHPAAGQVSFEAGETTIRLGAWLQAQAATSTADGGKSLDFLNRRARLTLDGSVTEFFDARIQPEFGGGNLVLMDAYVRLAFHRSARLWVGQFKRAFDLFELDSPSEDLTIESTGRISGVSGCAGVGSVCSFSRFTERLGYSRRDVGLKLDGALGEGVRYQTTLTNGTGTEGPDENSGKSAAARISFDLNERVTLSANVSHHDALVDGGTERGTAYGVDLEMGQFRQGTHLQVGLVAGDNWLLGSPGSGPPRFAAGQIIASWYTPLGSERFEALEPLVRVSWADAHRGLVGEDAWLFTPGVFLYVRGRNRIGANLDVYAPDSGDTEAGLKIQVYFHF